MNKKISRKEAEEKIDKFFQQENFSPDETRKIKRLAMRFNIKLGEKRKKFCRKCLSVLRGKTRVCKSYKSVVCEKCGFRNRFKTAPRLRGKRLRGFAACIREGKLRSKRGLTDLK